MLKQVYCLNKQGKRKNIEDNLFPIPGSVKPSDHVFIVCDGVGGEQKGEVASRLVCDTIGNMLTNIESRYINRNSIVNACQVAIDSIRTYIENFPDAQNMSTTLTLACINKNKILVAWCGDSRIYHLRKGEILWRSKDHSLVQQLIDTGEISEFDALTHPRKNIILRSINAKTNVAKIDIHQINNLKVGDHILLCTDGLLEQINESVLKSILYSQNKNIDTINKFIEHCEGKTNDNYSMYLLELGKISNSFRKTFIYGMTLIALTLILLLMINSKDQKHNNSQNDIQSVKSDSSNNMLQNQSDYIKLPVLKKKIKKIKRLS